VTVLEAHPWIGSFMVDADLSSPNRSGALIWRWNGAQPTGVDGAWNGTLGMYDNRVQSVTVRTTLRYGDVWLALGEPGSGSLGESELSPRYLKHWAFYREDAVAVYNQLRCPLSPADFWRAQTTLVLDAKHDEMFVSGYHLHEWLGQTSCPRG
jgi:hypothetical protein